MIFQSSLAIPGGVTASLLGVRLDFSFQIVRYLQHSHLVCCALPSVLT